MRPVNSNFKSLGYRHGSHLIFFFEEILGGEDKVHLEKGGQS